MNRIALEFAIVGLFVYAPLIFYVVWSWRWLRVHSADMQARRTWLGILPMSITVSAIWSTIISAILVFVVLLGYNLRGEERAFADVATTIAFLPAVIVSGIIVLFPGLPVYYEAELLHWLLMTVITVTLLLAISFIQWLLIQHIYVRSKA